MALEKFLKSSTIHGLVYLSRSNHIVERIFWIIFQAISIICTTSLIIQLVLKIHNFPIVVQLSDELVPVGKINFPAVTFCGGLFMDENSQYKVHTLKRTKPTYKELYGSQSEYRAFEKAVNFYQITQKLESSGIEVGNLSEYHQKRIQAIDLVTKSGILQRLNVSVPTHDILQYFNLFHKQLLELQSLLKWQKHSPIYLSEIMTESGLCLTFNMANLTDVLDTNVVSHDFHFQHVSLKQQENVKRPLKTKYFDKGLSGYIPYLGNYAYPSFCDRCGAMIKSTLEVEGIYVLIHDPYELPTGDAIKYTAIVNHHVRIIINPELMTIDDRLKTFDPYDRNCYLKNEKPLKFFKMYTRTNCEMECLSNFMIKRCGCVEFYMIRNKTTRICSASEKNCYDKARYDFEMEVRRTCNCLLSCEHVKYKVDLENSPRYIEVNIFSRQMNAIVFEAEFSENLYSQYISKKQFNEVDFLSFVGGLLGLFAGFSALSFVELIYWLFSYPILSVFRKRSTRVVPFQSQPASSQDKCSILKDYFQNSSVHGVAYFMETNLIAKLFWMFSFFLSIGLCAWLVSAVNEKVPNSRVISYDANINSVKNIPFPAITFVPELTRSIFIAQKYYTEIPLNDLIKNMTAEQFEEMKKDFVDDTLCEQMFVGYYNFSTVPFIPKYISRDSSWFSRQSSTFNHKLSPKFAAIRTIKGFGFTFNLLDSNKLLNEDEVAEELLYNSNISLANAVDLLELSKFYPYPVTVSSFGNNEFTLKMKQNDFNPDIEERCNKPSYKISHVDEHPAFFEASGFSNLKFGVKLEVDVIPTIIKTDEFVLNLDIKERDCYKEDEMKLRFFKKYTERNCKIECITNYTIATCNCSLLTRPYNPSKGIDLCPYQYENIFNDVYCYENAERLLYSMINFSYEQNCSCLPTCDSVSYRFTYRREEIEPDELIISVRMNMDDMVLYRRYQQFTFSDIISYVGGLLGLFAGISVLSIFEFVYFLTFRLWTNLWRTQV